MGRLLDGLGCPRGGLLTGLQGVLADGLATLDEHLQHEAAHLAPLAVLGGIVVEDGDILGALQQAVEIVGVDANLILDSGQFVGLADAVRNERAVVDAPRHVALVAGEQQDVVEVDVARLEHTHHLDALDGLAVEGDAGLLDNLRGESLQGLVGDLQIATLYQRIQAVDQHVGSEKRLLEQGVLYLVLGLLGYLAQHLLQGLCVVDKSGIGMTMEST